MPQNYDALKLKSQLCFPLYAASREIIKQYRPHLEKLGLTYTQYITMIVLWEDGQIGGRELGQKLFLDSGTLTPVLKSLEAKGLLSRSRSDKDERVLLVEPTPAGMELREKALAVPENMQSCMPLSQEEALLLHHLVYKILSHFEEEK